MDGKLTALVKNTPHSLDCISNTQNNPRSNRGTKFELPRGLERKLLRVRYVNMYYYLK